MADCVFKYNASVLFVPRSNVSERSSTIYTHLLACCNLHLRSSLLSISASPRKYQYTSSSVNITFYKHLQQSNNTFTQLDLINMSSTTFSGPSTDSASSSDWVSRATTLDEMVEDGLSTFVPNPHRCMDPTCPIKGEIHHAGPYRSRPEDDGKLPLAPRAIYNAMDALEYYGEPVLQEGETEIPAFTLNCHSRRVGLLKAFDEVHSWTPIVAAPKKGAVNGKGKGKGGDRKLSKRAQRIRNARTEKEIGTVIIGYDSKKGKERQQAKTAKAKAKASKTEDPQPVKAEPANEVKADSDAEEIASQPSDTTDVANMRNAMFPWADDVEEASESPATIPDQKLRYAQVARI
ncbi:MAG: hypothetical protein Q9218_004960 [Villophora microphyllina]